MKKILIISAIVLSFLAIFFYFVPAFRGDILVTPTIDLGPLSIRWYGLMMAAAILTGYFVARKYSWRFGIDPKEVDNLAFWLVIAGLLGARLYYVAFAFDYFKANPSEIYKLWHGGMSIFGALIAGLIFLIFYSKSKAYTKFQVLDLVALCLPLSQAVGRFGNFFNQEAYGSATNLPWKMYIAVSGQYHHPTFLYEAILNLTVFFFLTRLVGKVKSGTIALAYLILYSLIRFFIEPMRQDSVFISGFRVDQVTAFVLIVIAVIWFLRILRRTERIEKTG